jgi:hypothetical protein
VALLGARRQHRTGLIRIAADRDHQVRPFKVLVAQPGRLLLIDIHTNLIHDSDSPGVLAMGLDAG